jgi:hypothetical protein
VSRPALRPIQPPVQWVTRRPFPGAKALPGRDADHSPHLVPRSRMSRSCSFPPPLQAPPWSVVGQLQLYSSASWRLTSSLTKNVCGEICTSSLFIRFSRLQDFHLVRMKLWMFMGKRMHCRRQVQLKESSTDGLISCTRLVGLSETEGRLAHTTCHKRAASSTQPLMLGFEVVFLLYTHR